MNTPAIEAKAKMTDQGNPIRELSLSIRNDDGWIDIMTEELWAVVVTLDVDGVDGTWTGAIRSWSQNGVGVLTLTVSEDTIALFQKMIPDETIRIASFSGTSRGAVNTTIPMIFGGTHDDPIRVKGILVDRENFRYLIGSGELREIVAVLKDKIAITTGFTIHTGAASQNPLPGYAYIQFDADPRDDAGRWPDILVDVAGLKLGTLTEAECRNPAHVLYYLLTTADTGPCGWGLGADPATLDADLFADAIADCAANQFYLDGAIFERKKAAFWIDQICKTCRASFVSLMLNGG